MIFAAVGLIRNSDVLLIGLLGALVVVMAGIHFGFPRLKLFFFAAGVAGLPFILAYCTNIQ